MFILSSKTPCLLEATKVINEISVNLPSQFLISNITTYFDDNFDPLSMNSRIEVAKFEPGPTFENTINDIKDNHLKIITSATINLSAITLFDNHFKHLSMSSSIEVAKLKPEPTLVKTTNEIKDTHLKIIASTTMNLSSTSLFGENIEQIIMNRIIEVAKIKPEPTFEKLLII